MESTTQAQSGINLFGEETLSIEQIKKLSEQVHSSEASRLARKAGGQWACTPLGSSGKHPESG